MMQRYRRPAFLPVFDTSSIRCPKREQKEVAEANSYDDEGEELQLYRVVRAWTPNTGQLRWHDIKAYQATAAFLQQNLPLTVPAYKSVDAVERRTSALTRFADLRPVGQVVIGQLESFRAQGWAGGEAIVHARSEKCIEFMKNMGNPRFTRAHAYERWETLSVRYDLPEDCDDDAEIEQKKPHVNILGSNMMSAVSHNSAVLFADLIEAAVRKNYKRVQDQLAAMIVAETRPLTTDLGWVMHTSPLKESKLYSLIGSFLL
jgi:hypothetical protein